MGSIEFHNREKEIKEIRNILETKPTLITFIYGQINSGKAELINQIVPQLAEDHVVFYPIDEGTTSVPCVRGFV